MQDAMFDEPKNDDHTFPGDVQVKKPIRVDAFAHVDDYEWPPLHFQKEERHPDEGTMFLIRP